MKKMAFKSIYNRKTYIILIAFSLFMSGCQSIPNTIDKTGVIQTIFDYDTQLASKTEEDIHQSESKLAKQLILNESDAVVLALNNNATFNAVLADLKISKADLVNAGLLPNPELLFAFGVTNKPYRYAIDLPIEALWLTPIRLRTMKHEADAVAYRLMQSGLNLIKNVRVGYAQAVLAQEQLNVAKSSYQLRDSIYNLSLKRLEAGDINGKDILLAKNDAAIAKRDMELAEYDVKIKMQNLLYLLGKGFDLQDISLAPNLAPACTAGDVEQLMRQALMHRPDIISAEYSINAAKEKMKLSKVGWLKFTVTADATSGQVNGHTLGPAFRSTLPIANQNQGAISRAEAELEKAELTLQDLKQQALLEIKSSHLQYQQTCHDWHVLQNILIPTAQEMLHRTEQAYQKGDISYLQTLEASRQIVDTQMREVQLKADLIAKHAELMRSSASVSADKSEKQING